MYNTLHGYTYIYCSIKKSGITRENAYTILSHEFFDIFTDPRYCGVGIADYSDTCTFL